MCTALHKPNPTSFHAEIMTELITNVIADRQTDRQMERCYSKLYDQILESGSKSHIYIYNWISLPYE